jgi:hypothetical protein
MLNCSSRKRWLQRGVKKNLFTDLLATDVVQEIETLLSRQAVEDLDLEALELAVRQQVLQLAGAAVEQRLNADTSDERGSRTRCGCGQEARLVGRRSKQVQSVLGPLQLERAYYHCSSCGHGFCPRDKHLGIENTSLSPALTRMIGTVGAMVSFQEGSELLQELAGVAVDAKQVERTAEALGKEIAEDERHCTEPSDALPLPQTLYLGMDGTGIPLRAEELVGRTGKQPDGSAKTREVKLCTIWSAESLDEEGTPIRDEGSVTYSAALESACALDTAAARSPFAQRVWREATRRRFCQAPRRVVLGDGALWIWNIADDQFPDVDHGALRVLERSKAGHLVEVHVPEEIPAIWPDAGAAGKPAPAPKSLAASLEEVDFFKTPELRQAIHGRERGRCFYCLRQTNGRTQCLRVALLFLDFEKHEPLHLSVSAKGKRKDGLLRFQWVTSDRLASCTILPDSTALHLAGFGVTDSRGDL